MSATDATFGMAGGRFDQVSLRAAWLRDPNAAREMCARLQAVPGVRCTRVLTFSGHVTVRFDPSLVSGDELLTMLRGAQARGPMIAALSAPWLKWLPSLGKLALTCVG